MLNELMNERMAQVTLPAGIESISGRLGNVCFRTMKATGKVYVHQIPSEQPVKKPRPVKTIDEAENQKRFAKRVQVVNQMLKAGTQLSRKNLWKLASQAV